LGETTPRVVGCDSSRHDFDGVARTFSPRIALLSHGDVIGKTSGWRSHKRAVESPDPLVAEATPTIFRIHRLNRQSIAENHRCHPACMLKWHGLCGRDMPVLEFPPLPVRIAHRTRVAGETLIEIEQILPLPLLERDSIAAVGRLD